MALCYDLSPLLFQFSDPHVVNIQNEKPDGVDKIFIGRPSLWENPFTVKEYGRTLAIDMFEKHLFSSGLINKIHLLKGKKLVCFCAPMDCHGHIIAKHLYGTNKYQPQN